MANNKIHHSFGYAIEGVVHAYRENRNIRIHTIIAIIIFAIGAYFNISRTEYLIVLLTVVLVMSSEMINTSIEEMTNLITTEHRAEAKIAKDVAAGMVLVTSVSAVVVGLVVFLPYII